MDEKFILEIRSNIQTNKTYSILSGLSGYLILLKVLKKYDDIYLVIKNIVENFNKYYFSYTYSSGISGFLWTLNFLKENNIDFVDDVIEELLSILIKNSTEAKKEFNNSLDFLHGYTGYIHALIDNKDTNKYKQEILDYVNLIKNSLNKKEYKGEYLVITSTYDGKQTINYSLSHGMAAIIQVLSRIFLLDINKTNVYTLIDKLIEFILNNKNKEGIGSVFPNTYETINIKSRLAWCYGDLGIAIAIWQAGDNTGNKYWKQEAEKILLQTTTRTTLKDGMVVDPMICHGTSGIATIYNRMWRNTGNEVFLKARNHWLEETKKFARFDDGVAGYKYYIPGEDKWITNYGLLEGAIGIALAFLQAESEEDIKWDKALLISS